VAERPRPDAAQKKRNARRIAGSAGVLGAAAIVAAHAAQADFTTGATPVNQSAVATGNVFLTIPGAGTTNRMTLTIDNLLPDASKGHQRVVDVTNAGNLDLGTFTITTQATGGFPAPGDGSNHDNHLSDDGSSGLLMVIDRCDGAWSETYNNGDPTYVCGGEPEPGVYGGGAFVLFDGSPGFQVTPAGSVPFTRSTADSVSPLTNYTMTANATNHLRFRFKLPNDASTLAQGQSLSVTITFDGTARTGTNK
jgi:hypothetical protein